MYWIDKVIEELKWRSWGKFNVDWIEDMLKAHKAAPVEEEVQVVEIEPLEEKEDGEAEAPELPTPDEWCPKCWQSPCVCDKGDWEEKIEEISPAEEAAPEEEAWDLEAPSEEEKSRMDEILNAIKTFYPNEDTEDVLVRMVQKLIDK